MFTLLVFLVSFKPLPYTVPSWLLVFPITPHTLVASVLLSVSQTCGGELYLVACETALLASFLLHPLKERRTRKFLPPACIGGGWVIHPLYGTPPEPVGDEGIEPSYVMVPNHAAHH